MGSVTFSADAKGDSALDKVDGSTVCFSMYYCGAAYNATYNDGDEVSGNSIRYVAPAINGFTIQASMGLEGSYDNSGHTNAGASNAAGFLSRFVPNDGKGWVHIDLAAAFNNANEP